MTKPQKSNKKGFTLFETLISMAFLGVLLVIIFSTIAYFNKSIVKETSLQDTNRQFLKVFNTIHGELCNSSTGAFWSYSDMSQPHYDEHRWFMFLSPVDKEGKPHWNNSGTYLYKRAVIYYLIQPQGDKCKLFQYCPHKVLVRKCRYATGVSAFTTEYLRSGSGGASGLSANIAAYLRIPQEPTANFETKVVEENICDLEVSSSKQQVDFMLTLLKIDEAKRLVNLNEIDPANPPESIRKFVIRQKWSTITNGIN